ncbi:hypothetical protein DPMN_028750 [Dreissena polymorpha]|uniref:Mab-21-like nucleotidyltransferase domain-containing protein n=1 Tax=Dreissena polymorpha TaxID=45954 RepID=A0A9D4RFM4_DREPO|nr:hypothetical protein DPMN_028750 [Dreissena polymorpha]
MHCNKLARLWSGDHTSSERRIQHFRLRTARTNGTITTIITGSKAKGLIRFLESDIDIMFVRNNFVCLEDCVSADKFPREITVFRSYSRTSYPGHCRLLLERRDATTDRNVTDALCDNGHGHELRSSDLFVHNCRKCKFLKGIVQHDRSGPSMPNALSGILHTDIVDAFRYHCPSILSKWAARPCHWPLSYVVQQVVPLGAFLTPVGFKGREYQHVEWRVCLNAGEIELVYNLNETQIKLYFLLKIVKNDVLIQHKKEVSSCDIHRALFNLLLHALTKVGKLITYCNRFKAELISVNLQGVQTLLKIFYHPSQWSPHTPS